VRPFEYVRAADAAGAVAALAGRGDARFLAGGTNLVDLMRLGVETPGLLVDVRRLGLDAIEPVDGGGLRIGASATNSAVAADGRVRARWPLVSEALLAGASYQLRNVATIGGNLLQRTRCVYFQDVSKPCNKREGGRDPNRCPAIEGEHRGLAILGHSPACVATHPSDMAVALAALGARVHVVGPDGARTVPLPGLHRLPGDEPARDTVLAPGELIVAVELPADVPARQRYRKVRDRASYSFAVVSIAAALTVRDGAVADVRLALGGVAHVPWRCEAAEAELRDGPATEDAFAAAADAELAAARPLRDNAFKLRLARNLIVRTLADLT
jgi:xanthine dehydrogenase YagS FAD-binding subunit